MREDNYIDATGPDGRSYMFLNTEDGERGTLGYRMGEQTTPFEGNTTSAYYITDGETVWRMGGIMYIEDTTAEELESTLECWFDDEEYFDVVWENGQAVQGVESDY